MRQTLADSEMPPEVVLALNGLSRINWQILFADPQPAIK